MWSLAGEYARGGSAGALARRVLAERRTAPPTGTAEARAARKVVSDAVGGDDDLARRLVGAGVTDPDRARDLVAAPPATLELVERAAALGSAIRSLEVAIAVVRRLELHGCNPQAVAPLTVD